MLIDWFTVVAQAINFLVLVWLLKRFLYEPIIDAIDAREKRIETELADADSKKAEANRERDAFQRKNQEFDQHRASLLSQARAEAEAERQRLFVEARKDSETRRAKLQEAADRENQRLKDEVIRRTREEVFAIARKILADLAGESLEMRMCEVFTRQLREISGEPKVHLACALKETRDPVLVRTAFDLPPDAQARIRNTLEEEFSAEIPLRFETAPALVSGVELSANGQKVAWSIAEYLSALESSVIELLKEHAETDTDAAAHSNLELSNEAEPESPGKPT